MNKNRLLVECVEFMKNSPHVQKWYDENLKGENQAETINSLMKGIEEKKLTVKEALFIAFIVGLQWKEKFEGIP